METAVVYLKEKRQLMICHTFTLLVRNRMIKDRNILHLRSLSAAKRVSLPWGSLARRKITNKAVPRLTSSSSKQMVLPELMLLLMSISWTYIYVVFLWLLFYKVWQRIFDFSFLIRSPKSKIKMKNSQISLGRYVYKKNLTSY